MVVQKTTAGLIWTAPSGVQHAAAAAASTVTQRDDATLPHYHRP